MTFTVYILKSSKDGKLYIGQTASLAYRLRAHVEGKIRSTKNRRPLAVVHVGQFATRGEAMKREKELNSTRMRDFKDNMRKHRAG
jgi:putative endonuclease